MQTNMKIGISFKGHVCGIRTVGYDMGHKFKIFLLKDLNKSQEAELNKAVRDVAEHDMVNLGLLGTGERVLSKEGANKLFAKIGALIKQKLPKVKDNRKLIISESGEIVDITPVYGDSFGDFDININLSDSPIKE